MGGELRHLRVFLSSPGDVEDERAIVREIVEELAYDPTFRGHLTTEIVAWDKPGFSAPMLAGLTPQEAINQGLPKPSDCDIVVVIFWARMGTPLPEDKTKPDGTRYLSGTEWEYEDAMASKRKPDVPVYRRTESPPLAIDDPGAADKVEQYRRVNEFFARLKNPDGSIRSGVNEYRTPAEFRKTFNAHLRSLLGKWFRIVDTDGTPAAATDPLWPGSPYPGLRPFAVDEARIFFGRAQETDALIEMLRQPDRRFLAVWGASGSGKSSLVAAGLLPRLAGNAIAGSRDWLVARFTPAEISDDPGTALAVSLARHAPVGRNVARELAARLKDSGTGLAKTITSILGGRPAWAKLVVFADQFEELFTLANPASIPAFVDLLERLRSDERVRVIVTLRGDFLDRCAEWPSLMEAVQKGSYPLAAPGQPQLAEMIAQPAARAGLSLEPGLVRQILHDAGSEPGALPLMAYALQELDRARGDHRTLTLAAYRASGGIRGAIGQRAEAAFAALDADGQAALPRLFKHLVEVRADGAATRRRTSVGRAAADAGSRQLVDALTDARLLVQGKADRSADPVVEVAHEAIFQGWPRLQEWLSKNLAFLQWRRRYADAVAEWERVGRDPGALVGGAPLAEAERWMASELAEPTPADREFLEASLEEELRLARLRQEAERGRQQEALRLVAEAYRLLYSAPEKALLLAAQAVEVDPTAQAEAARSAALDVLRKRHELREQDERQWGSGAAWIAPTFFEGRISAQVSRDGRYAVIATDRTTNDAYLLDYLTLKLTKLEPPERRDPTKRRLEYIGFGISGRKIYLSRQFNIEIYAVDGTFEREFYLNSTKYPINIVNAIEDDRIVVAADIKGSVFTVDPETGQPLGTITWNSHQPVVALDVSPSGQWVAMLHKDGSTVLWPVDRRRDDGGWSSSDRSCVRLEAYDTASMQFSPVCDADVLVTAGRGGTACVWQMADGAALLQCALEHGMPVLQAAFSEDGSRLMTIAEDGIGRIWDTSSGSVIGTIGDPDRVDWAAIRGTPVTGIEWPTPVRLANEPSVPVSELPEGDRLQIAGQTWLHPPAPPLSLSGSPAFRILDDCAIRFEGPSGVSRLFEFRGSAWVLFGGLLSPGTIYRVDADSYTPFTSLARQVTSAEVVDGVLWLLSDTGAYRIEGERLEQVVPSNVHVAARVEIDGQTWFATSAGAYRLEGRRSVRISDSIGIREIKKIGNRTWILAGSTELFKMSLGPAYWIDGYLARTVGDRAVANAVEFIADVYWVATNRGLYGVDGDTPFQVEGLTKNVSGLRVFDGRLWAVTDQDIYRIDGRRATAFPLGDETLWVNRLEELDGRLWLVTKRIGPSTTFGAEPPGPLFRIDREGLHRAPTGEKAIGELKVLGGDVWLLSHHGPAYRLRDERAQAFPRQDVAVRDATWAGGAVWLTASDGAYRVSGDDVIMLPDRPLQVWGIAERDGTVVIVTKDEAFEVLGDHVRQVPRPPIDVSATGFRLL